MSNIRATTISDAAGTGPITMTGQSGAKVTCRYDADGTVDFSFNVSSATDISTGSTQVNYTNGFVLAASNTVSGMCQNNTDFGFSSVNATSFRGLIRLLSNQAAYDRDNTMIHVHGDLA